MAENEVSQCLFSVIIPVHNRAEAALRAVRSVLAGAAMPLEILVVDDGSTPALDLRENLEITPQVRCLRRENAGGPGAARNFGANAASGDYLVFLDSDDLFFPWTLACLRDALTRYDTPAWLSGSAVTFATDAPGELSAGAPLRATLFQKYLAAKPAPLVETCSVAAVRRDVFRAVGGFLEDRLNGEDHDLWLRLASRERYVWIEAPPWAALSRNPDVERETGKFNLTLGGIDRLLDRYNQGSYGAENAAERQRLLEIVHVHARPVAVEAARRGSLAEALRLYGKLAMGEIRLLRFRFLLAFPVFAGLAWLKRIRRRIS